MLCCDVLVLTEREKRLRWPTSNYYDLEWKVFESSRCHYRCRHQMVYMFESSRSTLGHWQAFPVFAIEKVAPPYCQCLLLKLLKQEGGKSSVFLTRIPSCREDDADLSIIFDNSLLSKYNFFLSLLSIICKLTYLPFKLQHVHTIPFSFIVA